MADWEPVAPPTVIPPPGSSSVHVDDNNTAGKIFNLVWQMADLCSKEAGSTRVLLVVAANPRKIVNRPAPWPHCSPSTPPPSFFAPPETYQDPCFLHVQREIDFVSSGFYDSLFSLFPDGSERRDHNL